MVDVTLNVPLTRLYNVRCVMFDGSVGQQVTGTKHVANNPVLLGTIKQDGNLYYREVSPTVLFTSSEISYLKHSDQIHHVVIRR